MALFFHLIKEYQNYYIFHIAVAASGGTILRIKERVVVPAELYHGMLRFQRVGGKGDPDILLETEELFLSFKDAVHLFSQDVY